MLHPSLRTAGALALACLALPLAAADYHPPQHRDDGWAVADAAALHWHTDRFAALEAKLSGNGFPGVTSVWWSTTASWSTRPTPATARPTTSTTSVRPARA